MLFVLPIFGQRLLQEPLRLPELLIGCALLFVSMTIAPEIGDPHLSGCGSDLPHGRDTMTVVVVIGRMESHVRLGQQAACG